MSREELLKSRGFRDEKHLSEFLDECMDETWKQELIEYFGEKPKANKKSKKVEEAEDIIEEDISEEKILEEDIPEEEIESETIEEASEEINEEE